MNRTAISKNLAALFVLIAISTGCSAQNGLKTKEIFMYKNGFTYVHAEGKVEAKNGSWFLSEKEIPNALFGAFWFQAPSGIQYILREIDSIDKAVSMPTVQQMMSKNIGKKIKLNITTSAGMQSIEGNILSVNSDKNDPNQYASEKIIAVIQTPTGEIMFTRTLFNNLLFAEFENGASLSVTEKTAEARLGVYFKDKAEKQDLSMVYLEKHDAWAPVYRLELIGDKKAQLTLGAEIKSGKLDIQNASLNLVVAQPTVFSANLPSCLSNEKAWQSSMDEGSYAWERTIDNKEGLVSGEINVGQAKAEDYHIYTISNFSMQKNQTAYVQILDGSVDAEHYFHCALPTVNEYTYYDKVAGNMEILPQEVYHLVKFKNPFKQPLTAAPIFVEGKNPGGGNLLIGQPVMQTTAIGGEATVQVARSLDLPVTQTESEKTRVSGAKTISNSSGITTYDLVTLDANLHLENQSSKEVTIKVVRSLAGKPLTSSADWKVVQNRPTLGSPNANNTLTWEIKLKPGEKKDINYSYEYYLRVYN